MPFRTVILAALLSACALAVGCGDDSDDNGGGGGSDNGGGGGSVYGGGGGGGEETESTESTESAESTEKEAAGATRLKLTADPGGALKFDKTSLSAKPGKVSVVLDNPSQVPHAIEVEGGDVEKAGETVEQGGVSRVTLDLAAGEYEFYCPVGNHADAGMEGTLTVR